ncbi:DUF3108 domain-containing protein [Ferrimonas balearica]|uniref:DUF3108 domain-containing protein n=1 Tax=Ferrimonas balearica TaxID=44012 RepID=UPI001C9911DE|nr:DUF3108 domain-containing protein [Ferrimonas balearica]MBY5990834.1 DUF3108 domain-containing protein [Ferrimonas balearica]
MYRLLIPLLFSAPLLAAPETFEARYKAYTSGIPCGSGRLSLSQSAPDQYRYRASGKICVLGQNIQHQSQFSWLEGQLQPGPYQTHFDGWFKDRHLTGELGPAQRYVVIQNGETLPDSDDFPRAQWEPAQMLMTLAQAREDVRLSYTWGDETRDYLFEYQGEEALETALGTLTTHKFIQDHPNEARVAQFWFAPELGGVLVRLEASRLGIPWLTVRIRDYRPTAEVE